jgi:hypothetical protein
MAGDPDNRISSRLRGRITSPGQPAAIAAWAVVLAGLAFYVVNFGSIDDTYGGLGTAALSLLWLTMLGVLYYLTPSLRRSALPRAGRRARAHVVEPQADGVTAMSGDPTPTDLARIVTLALGNDAAHESMSSALADDPAEVPQLLSELECDLIDWGFTYGVAWAAARTRYPLESDGQIAVRALAIAKEVFRQYRGEDDWAKRMPHSDVGVPG